MSLISLKQPLTRRELGYGLQLFALGLVLGAGNSRTVGQHWFLALILCLTLVGGWMIRSQAHE
jgi:hypothetical protein